MWHRKAANQARFSKPALPITCATFALDVLEGGAKASEAHEHRHQPLTFGPASLISGNLTTEKERMAAQVFQPGYRSSVERNGNDEEMARDSWRRPTRRDTEMAVIIGHAMMMKKKMMRQ
ncbi:hypothetical protein AMTR_s00021p00221940 [Amborella trichopoda]|uniref:Uncharacterized protein n=1 Tax=Amborella trichopoda TaxID=13333 RepID=W1PVL9_AMBTC|nr:hypothetical protein AMTR_s00021p00221940 [Amborella trichopoda]